MDIDNDFSLDPMVEALRQRDKERQEKIDSGEIVCDIQDPDNCESCSG